MWKFDLAVIGLGYVGLPLAKEAVDAGLRVVGFDTSPLVVSQLMSGNSHVDDVSHSSVSSMLEQGFQASTESAVLASAETICVCVPTPLSRDGGPDITIVREASRSIAENMQPGSLIIYESTTYPGSTEDDALPILESTGLSAGVDFNLAFSPERVDPGNTKYGIRNTPKIVGGLTLACSLRTKRHYERFVDHVVTAKGLREAEMAKLLENTYRHVNIALMNEIVKFSHQLGIDLWDVIECAATKPFGFQAFYPGPGVGGHCIPIDPNYLSYRVQSELGYRFRFVELAQEINHGMPVYVVDRCASLLNDHQSPVNGARVLLVGVTYKPNIADQRESPAVPIARELRSRKAEVIYHDPYVDDWHVDGMPVQRAENLQEAARCADLTVLLQSHDQYDLSALGRHANLLFDTSGRTRPLVGAVL